jgi:hypothetical protein
MPPRPPLNKQEIRLVVASFMNDGAVAAFALHKSVVGGLTSNQQEQVFKRLAELHGFGDPLHLQYVNGPNGLVPADAITQEIHAQFPLLDINSFL